MRLNHNFVTRCTRLFGAHILFKGFLMRRVLTILALLDDSDIDWLTAVGESQSVSANTSIITEGVPIDDLFIILTGKFAVQLGSAKTKIAELSSGEMVGEISLIDSRPPSASVMALTPSVVLRVRRQAINLRLETNKAFAARMYKSIAVFLATRLRSTVASMGYSGTQGLDEESESEDEISADLLDSMSLAGARFNIILERLQQQAAR